MNAVIEEWKLKYDTDVANVQEEFQQLLDFTDVERELAHSIINGFQKKVDGYQKHLRGILNVLRTPRLTRIYQKLQHSNLSDYNINMAKIMNEQELEKYA